MQVLWFSFLALVFSAQAEVNVEYGFAGGKPLLLDYHRPENTNRSPAVIYIHGGAWKAGDKANPPTRQLLERGYFTATINYRLGIQFPAALHDVKCAVRWLRANADKLGVDPNRIGVWGASAGGHLAELLGTTADEPNFEGKGGWNNASSRVATVVSFFGPADFTVGHQDFQSGRGLAVVQFLGGTLAEKPQTYRDASPVTHVSSNSASMLLVHGDHDTTVPLDQSLRMAVALKNAGVEHQLIVVTNGVHGVFLNELKPISPTVPEIQRSVIEWFDRHLKP